jgi:polyisoprenoid-binding protein YceI
MLCEPPQLQWSRPRQRLGDQRQGTGRDLIGLHAASYCSPVTAGIGLVWVGKASSQRDAHLRWPGFPDVDHHPWMTYGQPASARKSPTHARGELTLMGVTKTVPLALKVTGFGPDAGRTRAGFTATGELSWQDFGVTRNVVIEAGRAAADGKVTICLQIQAVLQA